MLSDDSSCLWGGGGAKLKLLGGAWPPYSYGCALCPTSARLDLVS